MKVALGPALRAALGPKLARRAARWYRAVFVDLGKETAALAAKIPSGAHLLDIGGGDGEPLNHLLALRPDLRVTTLDPGPAVGEWLDARFHAQVTRLAGTTLTQYLADGGVDPDALLIADVLHHIPKRLRGDFLASVRVLLERVPHLRIIVKDVEPGYWRASLGLWCDRHITGDMDVSPISSEDLVRLLEDALGPLRREETNLFETDKPNYAIAFFR